VGVVSCQKTWRISGCNLLKIYVKDGNGQEHGTSGNIVKTVLDFHNGGYYLLSIILKGWIHFACCFY